jgi:outer membrane protein assembly factor BamB
MNPPRIAAPRVLARLLLLPGLLLGSGGTGRAHPHPPPQAVYVGSDDGTLYALAARTGRPRWRFLTGDYVHSSPAVG